MAITEKPNILVVDDVPVNLELLSAILKRLDVNLILAGSGLEALEKIKDKEIAIALLDIMMEGMDGIELATCIQNDKGREKVPIIFISAHPKTDIELDECYLSGAVDFILKPFRNKIVLSKVQVFLDLYLQKQLIKEQKEHLEQVNKELETANKTLQKSEALLDKIIDNLPLMLFIKEAKNLSYVRINKAGEDLLGLSRDIMLGKNDHDFFPVAEAKSFINYDRKVIKEKLLHDIPEEIVKTIHNGERVLHTIKIPILNSEGEPEYLLGISEDVTIKKEFEKTLKESEKMYRAMLNSSPSGIIITDDRGRVTEISDIMMEIFGTESKEDYMGNPFVKLFPEIGEKKLKTILSKTHKDGLVQNVEFVLTRRNKSQYMCELSTTLIQGVDGKAKGYMGIVRDISNRKKIEQQLIRSERLVSLGEMASAMAHEINQPLLSITLGIENLFMKMQKDNLVDEGYLHDKSEKIFADISRIGRIIDHVRSFSHVQDDKIHSLFNVNESINNSISMISEQFKHYSVKLDISLDNNLPLIIGDTYKFEQVMINLLNNAKDALEDKEKVVDSSFQKNIKIITTQNKNNILVEVKDNGIGISSDDIGHIMLPFYTTKEEGRGTGLGLSISYGIIKELNGNIEIDSNSINGTTFKITLPFARNIKN